MYRFLILLLAQASAPTVDEIVTRSIAAIGGPKQFATVESLRFQGRMRFGKDGFTPFTVIAMRHGMLRMELTAGPDHIVQAYDGTTGWQSLSGQHNQAPVALSGDSLTHLADQSANAIGGPLLEMEKRGNKAEYAGREAVNGVDCFRLKVTLATGDTRIVFVDSSTYREVQEELAIEIKGQPGIIQQSIGDYRQFGPILVPCLFVTRQKGGEDTQRIEIDSVEINPEIDPSVFKM